MNVWFTSDLHLGHANIAKYCRRPWFKPDMVDGDGNWVSEEIRDACATNMNAALIQKWNERVKTGDTVFHIGDFCTYGAANGVPGVKRHATEWEEILNGQIIHIRGNHDANNTVKKHALESAMIRFGGKNVFMMHRPPWDPDSHVEVPGNTGIILCGHVHEKWSADQYMEVPVINVGVDVRNFYPMSKTEVIQAAQKTREYERDEGERMNENKNPCKSTSN
jgi:calcineurin-like phosphoesterase family protein